MMASFNVVQTRIHDFLNQYLPNHSLELKPLHQAMRYVCLNGGKRVRAALVYYTGDIFDVPMTSLDVLAASVELIHAYSLTHDDLPAMDNDSLRRGQPTCHIAFGEATAILVGDALQTLAFEWLAQPPVMHSFTAQQQIDFIKSVSLASGAMGMVGGQLLDMQAENKTLTQTQLNQLHQKKTGALICASVQLGALAALHSTEQQRAILNQFAQQIGLAFQIQDDILDVEGNTGELGKTAGSDAAHHKSTYPAILGLTGAKEALIHTYQAALDALQPLGSRANALRELAEFIVQRKY